MGRTSQKRQLQQRQQAEIVQGLSKGSSVSQVLKSVGLSRVVYERWRGEDQDFYLKCESAVEEASDMLEDKAFELALKGSERMLLALLKLRRPSSWGESERSEEVIGGVVHIPDFPVSLQEWLKKYGKGR